MTQGILFYSNNAYPLIQLSVSLYTLLPRYQGNIHLVFGPNTPNFIFDIVKRCDRLCYTPANKRYTTRNKSGHPREEWREKAHIIVKESPFDTTLYYDCDHCFFNEFDTTVFEEISKFGLVTAMGLKHPKRHGKVLRHFAAVGDPMEKYYKVNGGCIGYQKGCHHTEIWFDKMNYYASSGRSWVLKINSEEFALGYAINKGFGGRIDEKYSLCLGKNGLQQNFSNTDQIAVHFVHGRWLYADAWGKMFAKAYNDNFFELKNKFEEYSACHGPVGIKLLNEILKKNGV